MPPKSRVLSLVWLVLLPVLALADSDILSPPDTAEQIRSHGYPAEEHYVTTEDGYVLKMFRIPSGRRRAVSNKPLLMLHSILCSSDCWTLKGPENGFAFILADRGYDVWIGNNRGNTYSRVHMTIPSDDPELWNFGIHEMGVYDLPAMIDYITQTTNEPKVSYVAHSQGTTLLLIMASVLPGYQEKVSVATFFAPVAYLDKAKGFVGFLSDISSVFLWGTQTLGINHFLHNTLLIRAGGHIVCSDKPVIGNWCRNIFSVVAGGNVGQHNITNFPQITTYCPAGASVKQAEHYLQIAKNGEFAMFDNGVVGNLAKYGSLTPPKYPLEKVRVPILMFYSADDNISTPENVKRLEKELVNARALEVPSFSHLDFMWSENAASLLFARAIHQMVSYR